MAKEKYIRQKAVDKLIDEGWTLSVPCRSRYGSFINYYPEQEKTRGDDVFEIFDLIGWKEDKILFMQYTSDEHFYDRRKKVKDYMEDNNLELPDNCIIRIWGYKNREGFVKKDELTSES